MPVWIISIAVALLLQMTVFGWMEFFGAGPDLILITVVFVSFRKGAGRGTAVGFIGGLTEDFASGGIIGINAFVKAAVGYLMGSVRKKFDCDNKLFQFVSVFAASALAQLVFYSISLLCGKDLRFDYLRGIFLPFALYNGVLAPFVFRLLEGVVKHDRSKPD